MSDVLDSQTSRRRSRNFNRSGFAEELERLKRSALIEYGLNANSNSVDLFKWTLGSLLVVNGGALVALLGSDLRKAAFDEAALFFGAGLLLALLGGFFWTMSFSLVANDHMRRACDPAPLEPEVFERPKLTTTTLRWTIAAALTWLLCFAAFIGGCISMEFMPEMQAWQEANERDEEATYRFVSAAQDYIDLSKDPHATREELRAAKDRARQAEIEAAIANARLGHLLDPEEQDLRDKTRQAARRLKNETARTAKASK